MRVRWGTGRGRAGARLGMLAACLVLLVACGGNPASDPGEATPEPTSPSSSSRENDEEAETFELSDVVWTTGLDAETGEPVDDISSFPNNARAIIAVVNVDELPAGAEFTATWAIDGTDVPEATLTATGENAVADAWVSFQFTRAENRLFPLGDLEVTITASDGESVSGEVEITLP